MTIPTRNIRRVITSIDLELHNQIFQRFVDEIGPEVNVPISVGGPSCNMNMERPFGRMSNALNRDRFPASIYLSPALVEQDLPSWGNLLRQIQRLF